MASQYKKKNLVKKNGDHLVTGRKEKEIDVNIIKKLAQINCTNIEIAAVLEISVSTLTRRFNDLIKTSREIGKSSLRRVMWKKAINDENVTMLIWLSKNLLNYSDKHVVESVSDNEMNERLVIDFGEIKKPYKGKYHNEVKSEVNNDKKKVIDKIKNSKE